MAEGGVKASRSAEDLEKPEKPGKLLPDLLNKFESDPALRPQSLPVGHFRLSAQSFTSSSEDISTSQGNLKAKKANVRIKVPDKRDEHLSPSSADEDMLSDDEAVKGKKKTKRKLRWNWSPFKKMRKLFRRKKSPTRVKSFEDLPTEFYDPTYLSSNAENNDSLRNRAKSESSLVEAKTKTPLVAIEVYERRNTVVNPVQRTKSDPSSKGLKGKQDKSQESISEEPAMSSDERESQADSMNSVAAALDWSTISLDSGTEAAVSFENLPRASSLEGLQAAHDRIKVAPKHRRPPRRAHNKSSSMNLKSDPVKPHRRSKTEPRDLTVKPYVESTTNSDAVNATIFEALEISDEQSKEKVVADLKAKANNILANVSESPIAGSETIVNGAEEKEGQQMKGCIFEALEISDEQSKEKVVADLKAKANNILANVSESPIASSETIVNGAEEKEGQQLKGCIPNCTADSPTDNMNKENQAFESKHNLPCENVEEETKAEEKVLKERNRKEEQCRPVLDTNRRSESLNILVVKGKPGELSHFGADKPQLRKGFSLNSFESKEKTADLKLTKLMENGKPVETVCAQEDESTDVQNSADNISNACFSQEESNGSTLKCLDESVLPGAKVSDKEENSGQPAWIKLANRRSKRLSQLIQEGVKEESQVLLTDEASTVTSATSNDYDKPHVKEKPKVPTKPAALGKLNLKSKTFSSTAEKKVPVIKSFSQAGHAYVSRGASDKCAVCGTTVYQMEKCNFESCVLHRQCIKCTVCKRLLTVGNFVMAESKVYCKPHAKV